MSQIGGKMSKFQGEFVIVSIDLRIILSNYVATDVYALDKGTPNKDHLVGQLTKLSPHHSVTLTET